MTRKYPVKDCVIALRCDQATKEFLEKLAEARDITVSKLICRLISGGANYETQREEQLRRLAAIDCLYKTK